MTPILILASRSPRRRELLERMGILFQVIEPEVEEEVGGDETPRAFVERIAREKAEEVAQRAPGAWVLGADTVVVLGEEVLGKPRDEEEAASMLRRLSGRVHKVLTAFSLLNLAEGRSFQGVEETEVKFIPLQEADIRWYVSTGEPLGKAGAYAIQGAGGTFIEWIKGSYTNVVGLPVAQILDPLREIGIWRP